MRRNHAAFLTIGFLVLLSVAINPAHSWDPQASGGTSFTQNQAKPFVDAAVKLFASVKKGIDKPFVADGYDVEVKNVPGHSPFGAVKPELGRTEAFEEEGGPPGQKDAAAKILPALQAAAGALIGGSKDKKSGQQQQQQNRAPKSAPPKKETKKKGFKLPDISKLAGALSGKGGAAAKAKAMKELEQMKEQIANPSGNAPAPGPAKGMLHISLPTDPKSIDKGFQVRVNKNDIAKPLPVVKSRKAKAKAKKPIVKRKIVPDSPIIRARIDSEEEEEPEDVFHFGVGADGRDPMTGKPIKRTMIRKTTRTTRTVKRKFTGKALLSKAQRADKKLVKKFNSIRAGEGLPPIRTKTKGLRSSSKSTTRKTTSTRTRKGRKNKNRKKHKKLPSFRKKPKLDFRSKKEKNADKAKARAKAEKAKKEIKTNNEAVKAIETAGEKAIKEIESAPAEDVAKAAAAKEHAAEAAAAAGAAAPGASAAGVAVLPMKTPGISSACFSCTQLVPLVPLEASTRAASLWCYHNSSNGPNECLEVLKVVADAFTTFTSSSTTSLEYASRAHTFARATGNVCQAICSNQTQ